MHMRNAACRHEAKCLVDRHRIEARVHCIPGWRGGFLSWLSGECPEFAGEALALVKPGNEEVKNMATVSDCYEPSKFDFADSNCVEVAIRQQVVSLGFNGDRRQVLLGSGTARVVGEFSLKGRDEGRNVFCIGGYAKSVVHEA